MTIKELETIKINRSLLKSMFSFIASLIFVILGVWCAQGGLIGSRYGILSVPIGWISLMFFGSAGALILYKIILGPPVLVEFSPEGLIDWRNFKRQVLWSEISHVSSWSSGGKTFAILQFDPAIPKRSFLSLFGRMMLKLNPIVGVNGLHVGGNELQMSYEDFFETLIGYVQKFNPKSLG